MTTLLDVARRAGVSKSTVSNVIRGASLVSESTRERVERAIADVGYHPNAIARALKARTSTAIGIVVPDLANPFYAELAVGVERAASALGYAVLTAHTECSPAIEAEAGRALIERRVDGVVIGGISLGSALPKLLLDRGVPVVLASLGEPDDPRLGAIDHDDPAAMEAVVAHLHGLGHRASPSSRSICASSRASAGAPVSPPRSRAAAWRRWGWRRAPPPWWRTTTCSPSPP